MIHMNGRAYDPDLGRMLSADPFVQFAGYSQRYNRYSYVLNNPLAFTDPSGFCIAAGPSCPTSGFAAPTMGLGGSLAGGKVSYARRGITIIHSSFVKASFAFSRQFGSALGGGCNFTNSSGCGPGVTTFRDRDSGNDWLSNTLNLFCHASTVRSWTKYSALLHCDHHRDTQTQSNRSAGRILGRRDHAGYRGRAGAGALRL